MEFLQADGAHGCEDEEVGSVGDDCLCGGDDGRMNCCHWVL